MAQALGYRIYDSKSFHQATCREMKAAGLLVSFYGPRATIRLEKNTVLWREGEDQDGIAADDLEHLADVLHAREYESREADYIKTNGALPKAYQRPRRKGRAPVIPKEIAPSLWSEDGEFIGKTLFGIEVPPDPYADRD